MTATAALINATSAPGIGPFDAVDNDQSLIKVYFNVTLTNAVNYPAGGDGLDLSGAAFGDAVKALGPPIDVELKSFNSAGDSGFVYKYRPGTSSANGKIQVLTSNGVSPNPFLDLPAGAYPAGCLTDKILGVATFVRN